MKNNVYRGINNGINIVTNSSLAATDEKTINMVLDAEVLNNNSLHIEEFCDLSYHTLALPNNVQIFFHKDVNLNHAEITLPSSSIIYCYGKILGGYLVEGRGSIVSRESTIVYDDDCLESLDDEYSYTEENSMLDDIETGSSAQESSMLGNIQPTHLIFDYLG